VIVFDFLKQNLNQQNQNPKNRNKIMKIIIFMLISLLIYSNASAESPTISNLMSSIKCGDNKIIDSTIKSLGIEKGIGGGFKKCQILQPWLPESKDIYILALSWDPPDGYILFIDESSKVISKFKTGYVISLMLQEKDDLASPDLLIVNGTTAYGSGYRKNMFKIFSISKNGLNIIWEGISYLNDIYVEGKKIYGEIAFDRNPDHGTYKLKYDTITENYSYNEETKTFVIIEKETKTNLINIE